MTEPALESFFAGRVELEAVIEAVLEGRLGQATAAANAARLSIGCYEIFGGDASSPTARELVAGAARPRELVYGNDRGWRQLILDVHGDQVFDRPMRDYDPSGIDPASLLSLEATLPPGFSLQALDAGLTRQLDTDLEPHALQVFDRVQQFLEDGLGFGAVQNGQLACAATSYTRSSRSVEVAISTRPTFRGRGLAAATAARFLRQCLTEGLAPRWSASNPVSQRLAARLGYRPAGLCEVLYLRSAPESQEEFLLLASQNAGKLAEMKELVAGLPFRVVSPADLGLREAPEETGTSFLENAILKARHYARRSGRLTVADDSGLSVEALDGGPGLYSSRFGGEGATDADRNRLLLEMLTGVPPERRGARFTSAVAVARSDDVPFRTEATVDGRIAEGPRGTNGFGYDPLFFYPPLGRTFGEIAPEEKARVSHRGQAFARLREFLARLSPGASAS